MSDEAEAAIHADGTDGCAGPMTENQRVEASLEKLLKLCREGHIIKLGAAVVLDDDSICLVNAGDVNFRLANALRWLREDIIDLYEGRPMKDFGAHI